MTGDRTLVVFTAKSIDRILREGGTSSWRLVPEKARGCGYAVCSRNARADWVEGDEPHHMGFLVGKVKDVRPSPDYPAGENRFLIQFSEYAEINTPELWKGDRNPVKYSSLKELGIDPSTLKWEKMPEGRLLSSPVNVNTPQDPRSQTRKFYSRICWNTKGWIFPTGEAKNLESSSYVSKKGFGHEEWLFNFAWIMNGFHYAFLQPIESSNEKYKAQTIEILVYSINPDGKRVYVGELHNCDVLTDAQVEAARKFYKKKGWQKSMIQQIRAVGGDVSELEGGEVGVNIRFRPADAEIYSPPRFAESTDKVSGLDRYTLVAADQEVVEKQWRRRKGTTTPVPGRTIHRGPQGAISYDPIHPELQTRLFKLLKEHFGEKRVVILEEDWVDITIDHGGLKTLVEIKSSSDARNAIREALGQILDYGYYKPDGVNPVELVIVAPGPETRESRKYMEKLRRDFNIPVKYCAFSLTDDLPRNIFASQPE